MNPSDLPDEQSIDQILKDAAAALDEVRQKLDEARAATVTSVAYIRMVLVRRNGGAG